MNKLFPEPELEFNTNNNKEYEVKKQLETALFMPKKQTNIY